MSPSLYEKYQNFDKEKIFTIALSSKDYLPEAISTAMQIIKEREWMYEFVRKQNEQKERELEDQEKYEQEILEKAAYYKEVVEFKRQRNSFDVRIVDTVNFEAHLNARGIHFLREDKHVGPQIDIYPTQTYFFKNKDWKSVDEIAREIGLVTTPYNDIKPYLKLEVAALLVMAFVIMVLFFLLR